LLPWQSWFAGGGVAGPAAAQITFVLGCGVVAAVWSGFFAALYRVFGEPQRSSAIASGQRVISLGSTLGVLALGGSPLVVALTQLGVAVATFLFVALDVSRRHPPLKRLDRRSVDHHVALALLPPSALFAIVGIANALTVQGSVLTTSALLGALAVTVFSTSRTLANAVKQFVSLLGYVAWPEFTRMEAGGETRVLANAFWLLVKASSLLTVWIVSALWFTGAELHRLWTRGHALFDVALFHLLLVHAVAMTPSWASGVLLAATNRHRALSMLYLVQGLATVALSWALVPVLGLPGAALALIVAEFPGFGLLVPKWALAVIDEPLRRFMFEIYMKLVLVFAGAFCMAALAHELSGSGVMAIGLAIAASALPVGLGGWWWLSAEERRLVLRGLRRRAH
jgi:O-antigen/teichoic acid export membrane protein